MTLALIKAANLLQFDGALGWPETLTIEQISTMQSWRKESYANDSRLSYFDWIGALTLASKSEEIKFTKITSGNYVYHDDVIEIWIHRISATDFAAWLASQDEEPSWLVSAWFTAKGVSAKQRPAAPAPEYRILKRSALIEQHERDWPTIRADLSEAARNGLTAAASLGGGMWDVDAALAWAKARRKIRPASHASAPAVWPGAVTRHTPR